MSTDKKSSEYEEKIKGYRDYNSQMNAYREEGFALGEKRGKRTS